MCLCYLTTGLIEQRKKRQNGNITMKCSEFKKNIKTNTEPIIARQNETCEKMDGRGASDFEGQVIAAALSNEIVWDFVRKGSDISKIVF